MRMSIRMCVLNQVVMSCLCVVIDAHWGILSTVSLPTRLISHVL